MDWFIALFIVAPAFFLFLQKSTFLIDYLVWVTVLNRGIRRIVDWQGGAFNVFSPISLTPLIISLLIFLVVVQSFGSFPPFFKRILKCLAVALVMAFAIGFIRNGFAALYTLAEYAGPIAIMGFSVLIGGSDKILDRWIKTIGYAALFASIYGWWQYYTIPAWDAFWVRAVGFEGYLGQLRPTEMTVFSTMADRGPLAGFLALAVVPMMVSKRWRILGGWATILFIISCILLTYVRTALITIMLSVVLYPLLNSGKNSFRVILLICAVALGGSFFLNKLPGSQKITDRVSTISTLGDDGSFKGRLAILQFGLRDSISNPLGFGLGSTGLGGRVNTGGLASGAAFGDNGYIEILLTFGWVGAGLVFYSFFLLWKQVRTLEKQGIRSQTAMMFKALFASGAVTLFVANWISNTGAMVFYIFAGAAIYPLVAMKRMRLAAKRKRERELSAAGPRGSVLITKPA